MSGQQIRLTRIAAGLGGGLEASVIGAGPIGLACLEFLKLIDLQVIVLDRVQGRLDFVKGHLPSEGMEDLLPLVAFVDPVPEPLDEPVTSPAAPMRLAGKAPSLTQARSLDILMD